MKIEPNKYKNIIFDLGGVLLNIDYNLTAKAFEQLGISAFSQLFSQAQQEKVVDLYEKGAITSADFRNELRSRLPQPMDNDVLDTAWNCMLLDFPIQRLELLKKLKNTHRTFLLSNTNEIHMQWFSNSLQHHFGITDLSAYFEKVYLSYEIQLRKPDASIFKHILMAHELNPADTLFIDDSIQHIESASKLGIQTYWLDVKKENIVELFELA